MKKLVGFLLAVLALPALAATVTPTQSMANNGYVTITWASLAKNDVGLAAPTGQWRALKTVQINVTSAGEQSLSLQGSLDGTNWFNLHGVQLDTGVYVELTTITTSQLVSIIEEPLYIRPIITNGAGATAVDITVIAGAATRN